jgi:hypothetical protein
MASLSYAPQRAEISRRLIAAIFLPLFAVNMALLAAVGTTCDSCRPARIGVSHCAAEQPQCSPRR